MPAAFPSVPVIELPLTVEAAMVVVESKGPWAMFTTPAPDSGTTLFAMVDVLMLVNAAPSVDEIVRMPPCEWLAIFP